MAGAVMSTALKAQALRALLEDTRMLLDSVAESFWSSKVRRALGAIIDPAEVLSWYGGMGSFNDLLIAEINGHRVRREQEAALNNRLDNLRRRIYEVARELNA